MTDHDEPIDFSSIDPSRDPARWEEMIASVSERALAQREVKSIATQIMQWRRPSMMLAAGLALAAMGFSLLTKPARIQQRPEPTRQLLAWASGAPLPSTIEILKTLGSSANER